MIVQINWQFSVADEQLQLRRGVEMYNYKMKSGFEFILTVLAYTFIYIYCIHRLHIIWSIFKRHVRRYKSSRVLDKRKYRDDSQKEDDNQEQRRDLRLCKVFQPRICNKKNSFTFIYRNYQEKTCYFI